MVQKSERDNDRCGVSIQGMEPGKTVYCKLFNDMVTPHLCVLRRKELNAKGGFSCKGCSMDAEAAVHAKAKMIPVPTTFNPG